MTLVTSRRGDLGEGSGLQILRPCGTLLSNKAKAPDASYTKH